MNRILVIFSLLAATVSIEAAAFDWIELHEKQYWTLAEDPEVRADTTSLDSAYIAGLSYLDQRYEDKAKKMFEYFAQKSTADYAGRWGLAEIARREYRIEESVDILDDIIEKHPDFAPAKITRAYIHLTQKDYKKAIDMATEVLGAGKERVDTGNLVRANLIAGGAKAMIADESFIFKKVAAGLGALSYFKDARKINPDDPGVLFAWGSYYLIAPGIAGGDIKKAEEHLLRALEKDPRFADIHVRLAQLYYKKGNTDKYKSYLERAFELDPENSLAGEVKRMSE